MAFEKYRGVEDALRAALALPNASELALTLPPVVLAQDASLRDVSFVARGGMGAVYRAFDTTLGREVAIKVIRPGRVDPVLRARFRREAAALSRLRHPCIVEWLRVDERDGHLLLVMELVTGSSLRSFAKRAKDAATVLSLMLRVGEGLAAAHAQGFVHRDVKPENVRVRESGLPCLLDFGLTRAVTSTAASGLETLTRPGDVLGTASYAAPEQLRGERGDARSDQFSFAVTTLELSTGLHVGAAERVDWLGRPLAEGVREVLARAMDVKPERRFESMDALLEALRAALNRSARDLRG